MPSPRAANRFVRFAYRRPPPWRAPPRAARPAARPPHLRDPAAAARWQALTDATAAVHPLPSSQDPAVVPVLAHGVEQVLAGGLYPLEAPWRDRDARGRRGGRAPRPTADVFYKDDLKNILHPRRVAWRNIPRYVPAAADPALHAVAADTPGVAYASSTSSFTPAVAAVYHLISNFRDTHLVGGLSRRLADLPQDFSRFHRRPVAITITRSPHRPEVCVVNAHGPPDSGPSILRDLGHSMERMLTTPPAEFAERYVLPADHPQGPAEGSAHHPAAPAGDHPQFYHYSRISKSVLRAQIDCRNAATGDVFDVKTRAVAPIRYDLPNYRAHTAHRLRALHGPHGSYEREFYDMVRTVFLKYALQLRIGRMSGALVAYHNTTEILGLEYISLDEINSYVFGSNHWADIAFGTAVRLLERIFDAATAAVPLEPHQKLKLVLATEWSQLKMYIFAQRVHPDHDPLSHEAFLPQQPQQPQQPQSTPSTTATTSDFSARDLWHVDAQLHATSTPGFSIVGAHPQIAKMGGAAVAHRRPAAPTRRKPALEEDVLRGIAAARHHLNDEDLCAWELKVAPFVNDQITPKSTFSMEETDSFSLKYCLDRIPITPQVFDKFLVSLGRVYVK